MKILLYITLILTISNAKHIHKEKTYQKIFCTQYNGILEYKFKDKTRADCLTKEYAIEVDFAKKWAESIGQSLHYALMSNKKPAIVVIQEKRKDNHYIGILKILCIKYNITLFVINKKFEIAQITR